MGCILQIAGVSYGKNPSKILQSWHRIVGRRGGRHTAPADLLEELQPDGWDRFNQIAMVLWDFNGILWWFYGILMGFNEILWGFMGFNEMLWDFMGF